VRDIGKIIISWNKRKSILGKQINSLLEQKRLTILNSNLTQRINATVEWPKSVLCNFDDSFLELPKAVIIAVVQDEHNCIPTFNHESKITNYFIVVVNIDSLNDSRVKKGNEQGINAKLSDALFFYRIDREKKLREFIPLLKNIPFKNKFGTMLDNTFRIANIAVKIARMIKVNRMEMYNAAVLGQADLATNMIKNFPDVKGKIGKHFAKIDGEKEEVCRSIEEQYWPKQSEDELPNHVISQVLSISNKLSILISSLEKYTHSVSSKDPFGIRKAITSILRIIKEKGLEINLRDMIDHALSAYRLQTDPNVKKIINKLFTEKLRNVYKTHYNISKLTFNHVYSLDHDNMLTFDKHLKGLAKFLETGEAEHTIKSNKRICKLVYKYYVNGMDFSKALIITDAEARLYNEYIKVKQSVRILVREQSYYNALISLASLNDSISKLFSNVMILDEDKKVRDNRLCMINKILKLFLMLGIIEQ